MLDLLSMADRGLPAVVPMRGDDKSRRDGRRNAAGPRNRQPDLQLSPCPLTGFAKGLTTTRWSGPFFLDSKDAEESAAPVPPPWLSQARDGCFRVLRRAFGVEAHRVRVAARQLGCPWIWWEVAARARGLSQGESRLRRASECWPRSARHSGRPHRAAQRRSAPVLVAVELAAAVQSVSRREDRARGWWLRQLAPVSWAPRAPPGRGGWVNPW